MAASLYLLKATRHLGRSSDRGSVGEGGRGRWMDGRRSLGLKVRLGKERGDGQEGDLPASTSRQTEFVSQNPGSLAPSARTFYGILHARSMESLYFVAGHNNRHTHASF